MLRCKIMMKSLSDLMFFSFCVEDFLFSLTLQCKYLNHDPPNGLHRHCDEADDCVGESEMENKEVNVCATLHFVPANYYDNT